MYVNAKAQSTNVVAVSLLLGTKSDDVTSDIC